MDESSTTADDVDEIPGSRVIAEKKGRAVFSVVEGSGKGERFEIPHGGCRAIGRSLDEEERTRFLHSGAMINLDEFSKKLVSSYVNKQYGKREPEAISAGGFAGFHREPDFILQDKAISRLHAIIFFDVSEVGVLDLVSKNGTFVNGVEVESKMLKVGDLMSLGVSKIRFEGCFS